MRPGSQARPIRRRTHTCELFRPEPEEVLFNVSSVTAKLRLDPGLRAGDKATVTLDGRTLPDVALAGADFNIPQVYRGQHTVAAVVQNLAGAGRLPDRSGDLLCEAGLGALAQIAPARQASGQAACEAPRKP